MDQEKNSIKAQLTLLFFFKDKIFFQRR
jgi:hypothetical protein